MDVFKLNREARKAFQRKVKQKQLKRGSLTQDIKQEIIIKIEPEMQHSVIKQENIKIEQPLQTFTPMNWEFNETKHVIANSHLHTNKEKTVHEIKHEFPYTTSDFRKNNLPPKNKYPGPRRRPPIFFKAVQVHKYLSAQNPSSLTEKQLDSLTWAESVIMGAILRRMSKETVGQIDIPDDGSDNDLNRAFISDEIEVIPETYQLAIVDFANPGGRYSLENARLIEKTLGKAVVTQILTSSGGKIPVFGKSVYYDGVLVLDCKDQAAYDFAKLALCDIKLWDGSKLKMVESERTPFNAIAYFETPDVGIAINRVLDVLAAQNLSISMHGWKILGETSLKNGNKKYSILMHNPPVYYRRHKQLRLFFGGSEVILKHFGCEWLWNCKV